MKNFTGTKAFQQPLFTLLAACSKLLFYHLIKQDLPVLSVVFCILVPMDRLMGMNIFQMIISASS